MTLSDHDSQWYARRNGTVRGPFTEEYIARYILLGRIQLNDELSRDRVRWQPARDCQGMFPQELLRLSRWEDYQKLVVAHMKADERLSQRRGRRDNHPQPVREERRKLPDRRHNESGAGISKFHLMDDKPSNAHGINNGQSLPLRTLLLVTLLVTLVLAYFSISSR
jgi:hypothetical protein